MAKTIYVQDRNSFPQTGNTVKLSGELTESVPLSRLSFDKIRRDKIFPKIDTSLLRKKFDIDKDFQSKSTSIAELINSVPRPALKTIDTFGNLTSINKLVFSDNSDNNILQVKNNNAEKLDINLKEEALSKFIDRIREDDILTLGKKYSDIHSDKNSNETIFKPINGVTEFKIDDDIFDDISDGMSPNLGQDISIFKQNSSNIVTSSYSFDTDTTFSYSFDTDTTFSDG